MQNGEIWKDIPGYVGKYRVSNTGFVCPARRWQALKPSIQNNGYHSVWLRKDGSAKAFTVHRLVMLAFVGERPDGMVINHKDSNPLNNRLENLEYVTPQGNSDHAKSLGRIASGTKNGSSRLTEAQVAEIRSRYAAGGISRKVLARQYGVAQDTIRNIVLRITWKHVE